MARVESMLDLDCAYPIVYSQTITVFIVDDLACQSNPNLLYASGNTFFDAIDGSYCTYSAYGGTCTHLLSTQLTRILCLVGTRALYSAVFTGPQTLCPYRMVASRRMSLLRIRSVSAANCVKLGVQGVSFILASGDSGIDNYSAPYGYDGLMQPRTSGYLPMRDGRWCD